MLPRWDGQAADDAVRAWGAEQGEDLALLAYASRLLGSDPRLVLHGGGNTSIKRDGADLFGRPRPELWVKASGHDLATIGPSGFAPCDLLGLAELGRLPVLSDDAMMLALSRARLAEGAPFPSVETLFHAVVPARCIVHTHANAVLILTAQPDPRLAESVLGADIAVLPYVRPGHGLARAAAEALAERPHLAGIVFRQHGIFTFGDDPREATERMLDAVARCRAAIDERLAAAPPAPARPDAPAHDPAEVERIAAALMPALRGALAIPAATDDGPKRRVVTEFRTGPAVREALAEANAADLAGRGVITPDHLIRTRHLPLVLDPDPQSDFQARAREAVARYAADYRAYVERNGGTLTDADDAMPRVVLLPGLGFCAAGLAPAEAAAAADITAQTIPARRVAERIGRFEPLPERAVYETEFWPPEREKLRRMQRPSLAGRVALVTGAAGAIGAGVAAELARAGARVFLADRPSIDDEGRLARVVAEVRDACGPHAASACPFDVTDPDDVERAFADIALAAGGADLLVLSHGAALVGDIKALDPDRVEALFGINALGNFNVLGAFARQVEAQGTGGDVVLISTKNVPEPGASFAAYSASKAAAHQLARVAAIEMAPLDIRVNMVSPDAVFGDAVTPSLLWQTVGEERAKSRGIDPATLPEQYRLRNLLKTRVTAAHVAAAVLFFAERRTPTTGAFLPVDGGLPGAFPR